MSVFICENSRYSNEYEQNEATKPHCSNNNAIEQQFYIVNKNSNMEQKWVNIRIKFAINQQI